MRARDTQASELHTHLLQTEQAAVQNQYLARRSLRYAAAACGLAAFAVAAVALIGRFTGNFILASYGEGYKTMVPVVGLSLVLLAVAVMLLALLPRTPRTWLRVFGGIVMGIAGLRVVEFACGTDWGSSELFLTPPWLPHAPEELPYALPTAAALFAAGWVLILLMRQGARVLSFVLVSTVTTIGAAFLLGYVYGKPLVYGHTLIPLALPAAISTVLVGTGMTILMIAQELAVQRLLDVRRLEEQTERERLAERLSALVETMPAGVLMCDAAGQFTLVNEYLRDILGITVTGDASGPTVGYTLHHPDGSQYQPEELPLIQALTQDRTIDDAEIILHTATGARVFALASACPLRDRAGGVIGAVAIIRDITALHLAQEELRQHQDHLEDLVAQRTAEVEERSRVLESIFNNSLSSLVLLDQEFNFIRVNESYARACARTTEDFNGHNHFVDYPSDLKSTFEEVVRTKRPWSIAARPFEFPDHPDWGVSYWDLSVVPILDVQGEVALLLFSLHDVTERERLAAETHQRAAELAESERQYRELVQNANSVIIQWDQRGTLSLVNEYAERLFGYAPGELVGQDVTVLVPPSEGTGRSLAGLKEAILAAPEAFETNENENVTKDGRRLWVSWSNRVMVDEQGDFKGIMAVGIDQTAHHEAEEELLRLNRMYSALSRANEAIVCTRTREELFHEMCRIAVEDGKFRMAWIGMLDPESSRVIPCAHWGHDEGYLSEIKVSAQRDAEGLGPTGRAVRDGAYQVCNDIAHDPRMAPWAEHATQRGYRSSGAFPFQVGTATGALTIYSDEPGFFNQQRIDLLQALAVSLSIALEREEAERRRLTYQDQLRQLASELALAEERERRRIAASIHDDLIQNLAFAKMKLALTRQANQAPEVSEGLDAVGALLDDAIQYTRGLTFEVSLPILYQLGFEPALEWLTEHMEQRHGHTVRLEIEGKTRTLNQDAKVTLFQAVRELLTNAAKHAQAKQVVVSVSWQEQSIEIEVADDGVGLEAAALDGGPSGGFGLFHIQERLRYLGGRLVIEGAPGAGAKFTMVLPLPAE